MKRRSIQKTGPLMLIIAFCLLVATPVGSADITAADQDAVTVDVSAQSTVDREMILLGDVARIGPGDAVLSGALKAVAIGRSPLPGSSRMLSPGDVLVRLKQAGIDTSRIRLQVPETAKVTRRSITIEGDQIKEIVSGFIRQTMADPRTHMTIKDIRVPERVVLPSGRVRYEVASGPRGDLNGNFGVTITFRVNESFEKKVLATVTIEALVDAVVTVRAMGRYGPITPDDVEVRRIDLSDLPANFISDPDEVIGKRTRRAIHSNQVLSTEMVELPPLVKRGDLVTIVARIDGLKITALGQVKKQGRQGERIPVVNMDSQKVIYARVLDANTVAVDF